MMWADARQLGDFLGEAAAFRDYWGSFRPGASSELESDHRISSQSQLAIAIASSRNLESRLSRFMC
jgi:hypothetical protein